VEVGRLLRAARQQSGLSQRALAERAGVSASVVAHAEADDANPPWELVQLLLAAAGHDLQLAPRPELPPGAVEWLWQSTSARLYRALGGRQHHRHDRLHPAWVELGRIATGRCVVLGPELSAAMWLPDRIVEAPSVVSVTANDRWGRPLPTVSALHLRVGPVATAGTVPVGVTVRAEVQAHPPDSPLLRTDPATGRALSAVAALLDAQQRRDRQGRRSAAQKDSRTMVERDFVQSRRRFGRLPEPDPRERRDWRLGGAATFREWMERHGYPLPDDEPEDADDEPGV
jgi:transcriptional regulator with XRE-family HTH domain